MTCSASACILACIVWKVIRKKKSIFTTTSIHIFTGICCNLIRLGSPEGGRLADAVGHQIGIEVAISELSKSPSLSQKTVENYLDILEKMFVLVNIRGFSRNLRKEVTKTSRYYFVDVGVRNALIRSFVPLSVRNDVGELFENWFVMERIKLANNHRRSTGFYFLRTYDQHEIDLVEDLDGRLMGFECKWTPKSRVKVPKDWLQQHPEASFEVVSLVNWMGFLEDKI